MLTNHGPRQQWTASMGAVLGLCLALVLSLAAAPAGALSPRSTTDARYAGAAVRPPAKGLFLVASPDLADPNFQHTVILICEHSQAGSLGLVVNRPTNLLLSEALPDVLALKGTAHLLFAGGPVQADAMLMLFRLAHEPAKARRVLEGIYLGGDLKDLDRLATQPGPAEGFRAFAGYAGWGPGQLEWEMAQGSWNLAPGDAASIFEKNPADLWQDLNGSLPTPGVIQALRQPTLSFLARFVRPGLFIPDAPSGA